VREARGREGGRGAARSAAHPSPPCLLSAVVLLAKRDVLDMALEGAADAAAAAGAAAFSSYLGATRGRAASLLDSWRGLLEDCEAEAEAELAAAESRAAAPVRAGSAGEAVAAAARAVADGAARLLRRVDAGPPPAAAATVTVAPPRPLKVRVGSDASLKDAPRGDRAGAAPPPDSPAATLAAPRSLGVRALQGVLNDIMDAKARADAR